MDLFRQFVENYKENTQAHGTKYFICNKLLNIGGFPWKKSVTLQCYNHIYIRNSLAVKLNLTAFNSLAVKFNLSVISFHSVSLP